MGTIGVMKRALVVACALVASSLAMEASTAEAQNELIIEQPHTGSRPVTLDIQIGPMWYGWGLATGARLGIPLVKNGFIGKLNNAVYLSVGADFYFIRYYRNRRMGNDRVYGPGFGFPVALHWEFYFTEKLSAFGEIGANIFIPPWVFDDDADYGWGHYPAAWFLFAVGGKFHINDHFALVARLGTPYTSFGISLSF